MFLWVAAHGTQKKIFLDLDINKAEDPCSKDLIIQYTESKYAQYVKGTFCSATWPATLRGAGRVACSLRASARDTRQRRAISYQV